MSTAQTDALASLNGLPQPESQEQPLIALTGRITKVGDPVTTKNGKGDYDQIELTIEPTNSSRKISFINVFFRPEFFSFGQLNPKDMYVANPRHPYFAAVKEDSNPPKTNGESFTGTYGMAVMPQYSTYSSGELKGQPRPDPKTGKVFVKRITPVMAIAGATLEGFANLVGRFKAAVAKDGVKSTTIPEITELTSKQIVDLLNEIIVTGSKTELLFTARQKKDQSGQLTDNYEFNQFEGVLDRENLKRIQDQAEKTKNEKGRKKLVIRFKV